MLLELSRTEFWVVRIASANYMHKVKVKKSSAQMY